MSACAGPRGGRVPQTGWPRGWSALAVGLALASALAGCAHPTPRQRAWGKQVPVLPSAGRLGQALRDALLDPVFLVSALGAGLFAIDDWDREVSDWAVRKTPVFGSKRRAVHASDVMRDVLRGEWAATFVATPSGEPLSREWWRRKAAGGAVEFAAWSLTGGLTLAGKAATGRTRPDGSDDESLPSGHSSGAFAMATLSNRNLDAIALDPRARAVLQVGNIALATATAWARVEGQQHFPSDVLAGAALGRFLSAFVHDAWMLPEDEPIRVEARVGDGGATLLLDWRF